MATEKRLIWGDIAEEHLMKLAERYKGSFSGDAFLRAAQEIEIMPTVDAVEVVHGRWIEAEDGDGAVCSVCGEDFCNVYLEVERFLYCPNCGAKMDGDGNGSLD